MTEKLFTGTLNHNQNKTKTYIRLSDFQSKSELLMTEKVLPFTDEVIVVLVHKCLQQLQFLALYIEMIGYTLGLLKGFGYLCRTVDLIGEIPYCQIIAKNISIRCTM